MLPFGALLAGVPSGYQEGAKHELEIDAARDEQQGRIAFGKTLQQLGLLPGATPVPPSPGQPSMPMQRPMGPSFGPPAAQPPMVPPQGGPPPPPGAPPAMQPPGPPQGGPTGALDWRQVTQMVTQANPGAKPEVIAAAVNQFLPLMNQQAQMEWRLLSAQLAQQRITQQGQLGERRLEETERRDTMAHEDRQSRDAAVQGRFDTREARLQQQFESLRDNRTQTLEQRKEEARQRALRFDKSMDAKQRASTVAQWRDAHKAQDAYLRSRINAMSNLQGADKKEMLKQLDTAWYEEERQMQEALKSTGGVPKGSAEAQPQGPPTGSTPVPPDVLKKLRDGIKAGKDSKENVIRDLKERGFATEGLE